VVIDPPNGAVTADNAVSLIVFAVAGGGMDRDLGGDALGFADITFASLAALAVLPPEYGGRAISGRRLLIEELDAAESILSVAEVVLQEHDLTLVRSAVTLTVSGDLDEPEELEEDIEDDEDSEDTDLYEMLIQFRANEQEYGLFIPLDPFFVVARLQDGEGVLVEGEEFERIQPRIEAELDERELADD
jgi:hypothetical protein